MPGVPEAMEGGVQQSYRRGYRDGIRAIVEAAEQHLRPDDVRTLRTYVEASLSAVPTMVLQDRRQQIGGFESRVRQAGADDIRMREGREGMWDGVL